MPREAFERFRALVLREPELQARLRDVQDSAAFLELVVRLGGERGCHFTSEEVQAVWQEARRAWFERWP